MAFVGVLSTQLLWDRMIHQAPETGTLDENLLMTKVSEEGAQ
jgi:hypothetical protein